MDNPIELNKVEYLGDGLYILFDGYQIWLMANSHIEPTDKVALDLHVYHAFLKWSKRLDETILKGFSYKEEEENK